MMRLSKNKFIKILVFTCLGSVFINMPITMASEHESDEILLGMSTALTGPASDLGKNVLCGFQAGFSRINQQGGIHNRKISVVALDDGYEPQRTIPNIYQLIDDDNVLAVIGNVGTPTAIATIPIVTKNKILLFAPYTGAGVLRKNPPDRYVINYRASYAQETAAMIDALINEAGLKPQEIAFFTQRDGYGDAGFHGGITALKKHGLKDQYSILHTRYERNTTAIENAVADILMAKITPRAIIMVGAYAPSAKFIKMLKDLGVNTLFLNVSFVGSQSLAKQLGVYGEGVIVTQVVPHPEDVSLEVIRHYQRDMKARDSKASLSFGALEGYIASQIFIKALQTLKEPPTRENIIDALESLSSFDIGLGVTQKLDANQHQSSNMVWPTVLINGMYKAFSWSDIKRFTVIN